MAINVPWRRAGRRVVLPVLLAILAAFGLGARPAATAAAATSNGAAKPTIVLVHGAWADSSSWNAVAGQLQERGYTVIAPANPLRGVQHDSAYLASVLATISGPAVVVGHSWRTIPSWYLVATDDRAIPAATERFMAQRAGATTVEVAASHVAMISQPDKVTDLIVDAAGS